METIGRVSESSYCKMRRQPRKNILLGLSRLVNGNALPLHPDAPKKQAAFDSPVEPEAGLQSRFL
jgi:hypothetical protein